MNSNETTQIENALEKGKVFTRKYDYVNDFPIDGPSTKVLGHICKLNDIYFATKKNYGTGENVLDFIKDCHKDNKTEIKQFDSLKKAFNYLSP